MPNLAQQRALKTYRARLQQTGLARFEVLGLDTDRTLIRSLAKRLVQNDPEANRIRSEVARTVAPPHQATGGILAALRRSPLVDANLVTKRSRTSGRKVNL